MTTSYTNLWTYGTIASLILMIVFCFIEIVFCIGRLFSYTSRRLHFIPLLILLCGLITMLMPALLDINAANWTAVSDCFKIYFQTNWTEIVNATENPAPITFNLFFPILLVFPLLTSIMPILFKNREAKTIAFVPKGNKPHTYRGQKNLQGQDNQDKENQEFHKVLQQEWQSRLQNQPMTQGFQGGSSA